MEVKSSLSCCSDQRHADFCSKKGGGALGHPKVFSEQLVCVLKYVLVACIVNLDKPGPKACGYVCLSLIVNLELIKRFL